MMIQLIISDQTARRLREAEKQAKKTSDEMIRAAIEAYLKGLGV